MIASVDDFRGQARLLPLLGRYLAQGKLSGSLLLVGQRGVGKTALASMVARAVCCEANQGSRLKAQGSSEDMLEDPSPNLSLAPSDLSLAFCSHCYACRSIASGNQPEYRVIRPAGTQIKVEQFNDENSDVLASMSLHPVHLPRRILVVDDAHTLNEETANRMLKLLEEGPRRSLFIFVTDRPPLTRRGNLDEGLLPTITSRCLRFNLLPMNRWELEEDLAEVQPSLPRAAVIQATVMSGGSIVQSRQLAGDDAWRSAVTTLTDALCRKRDIPERAGELADHEFAALWAKGQADTGLTSEALTKQCSESWKPSDKDPLRVMTTARRNELQRQALASGYDRAVWWLLHEAARGLEWPARVEACDDPDPRAWPASAGRGWDGAERRKASPPLPPPGLMRRLALLKQRIFGNVESTLAQAAFEATI